MLDARALLPGMDETVARLRGAEGAEEAIAELEGFLQGARQRAPEPLVARALALIDADPERLAWTELAVTAGYDDQPHVIRAFRRFSGWTPTEYHRLIVEHGPDAARFVPLEQLPPAARTSHVEQGRPRSSSRAALARRVGPQARIETIILPACLAVFLVR